MIGAIVVVGVVVGLILLCLADGSVARDKSEHSVGWHRANGQWRVRYPDGKISQPFSRRCAEDYREIFGGEVIPK